MAAPKTIDYYKEQWEIANAAGNRADMDAAHAAAEELRAKAGYSGGADGSEYIPIESTFSGSATGVGTYTPEQQSIIDQMNENSKKWWVADENERIDLHNKNNDLASMLGGSVDYDPETGVWSGDAEPVKKLLQQTGYNSPYSTQIDSLLNSILNREPFSYDYKTDPTYLAYEDKYKRLGDRAREDVLGDVAAMNGGYASSWGVTAASQAQNDYNQQLSDIIPTLYDAAYNRYLDEDSLKRSDLGLVLDVDNMYYGRYRDDVADSQWEKEFGLSEKQFDLSKDQFDWNKDVDTFNQMMARWEMTGIADNEVAKYFGVPVGSTTQFRYFQQANLALDQQNTAFNQMMARWETTGVADAEVAKFFGVPEGATTQSKYYQQASLELDQAKLQASQKGQTEEDTNQAYLEESIVRQAREVLGEAGTVDAAAAAAEYVLSAGVTSAAEFFRIGSKVGIPTAVLQSTFDKFYNMALQDTGDGGAEQDYAYYAALMGQQSDPAAWLTANKYSIPPDIIEDLYKLLDY